MKRSLLDRVDAEVEAGRAWRAKEILRGHVAASWPGQVVSERYGVLLANLGDRLEGDKYLFLSGVRKPEYTVHISLFLSRHGRSGPENLLAQFPRSFRRQRFLDLPLQLQSELSASGVRKDAFGERIELSSSGSSRWANFVAGAVGLLIIVSLIVGVGMGARQVLSWISALWR